MFQRRVSISFCIGRLGEIFNERGIFWDIFWTSFYKLLISFIHEEGTVPMGYMLLESLYNMDSICVYFHAK